MRNLVILAILLAACAYGGAKWHLHNEVNDAMEMGVMMMSPFAAVEYGGVSSTMSGELTVDDLSIVVNGFRDPIRIDRVGIDTPSFLSLLDLTDLQQAAMSGGDSLPEYVGFLVEGLRVPADADYFERLHALRLAELDMNDAGQPAVECAGKYGFSPEALAELGYDQQVLSVRAQLGQDEAGFYFDVESDMDEMWDLEASVKMVGALTSALASGSTYRPRLAELWMEFTDLSLNERVASYCERLGLSPEEAFAAQIDAFRYLGESNGIVFDEYVMDPYEEFLNGKSTLTITAQPNEPVGLSRIGLYKPSDVPALLNLSATAK